MRVSWAKRWQALRVLLVVVGTGMAAAYRLCLAMPGRSYRGRLPALTPGQARLAAELRRDVMRLASEGERNVRHHAALVRAGAWIEDELRAVGYEPRRQAYTVCGRTCFNVEAQIHGLQRPSQVIVVGAHYDSAPGVPGANDNASGVSALLALARRMCDAGLARTLRMVWFANEEPPHFQQPGMGSLHDARAAALRGEDIVAMLCLETMGYFSDARRSQKYPALVRAFYPSTGNFIGFIGNFASRALVRHSIGVFRRHTAFPSQGAALPERVGGVASSDPWSFWRYGYRAVTITDTARYRYPYYHSPADTADKLDYDRLARVVEGLIEVIGHLSCVVG